jgi:hypothetical protein
MVLDWTFPAQNDMRGKYKNLSVGYPSSLLLGMHTGVLLKTTLASIVVN